MQRAGRSALFTVLGVYTIYTVGPLFWLFLTSAKTTSEIYANPLALPSEWAWRNFTTLLEGRYFTYYWNSIVVTILALVGVVFVCSMAGYGFARFRFPGKEGLFGLIFSAILLPVQLVIIPLFLELRNYGLINSRIGLALVYTAFAMPISIYILRTFFVQIPETLAEAATLDGAGEWQLFSRIMMPLARPAVLTVMILQFVFLWNEYIISLIVLQKNELRTLPVGLTLLSQEHAVNIGATAAALVVSVVPMLILYTIFSERFIRGMMAGSIKG